MNLLARAGSSLIRFFSKSGRAAATVTGAARPVRFAALKRVWNVVDKGLTAYAIYDIFWGDDTPSELKQHGYDYVISQLLTPGISAALTAEISDSRAAAFAFANMGVREMSDSADGRSMTAVAYLMCSDYLVTNPSGLMYSKDQIVKFLSEEMGSFIQSGATISEDEIDSFAAVLEDMDLDSMPVSEVRKFDFLCFLLEQLLPVASDLKEEMSMSRDNSGRLPVSSGGDIMQTRESTDNSDSVFGGTPPAPGSAPQSFRIN